MKEEKILQLIQKSLSAKRKDVVVGIGDDTAVLKYDKDNYLLFTTDSIVENVHFKKGQADFYQIGKKAIAVNLSDIAAMGGIPAYAVVSVGLPEGKKETINGILRGMKKLSDKYKFDIVGGNLTKSPFLFIDVFLVGKIEKKYLKLRSGAKPGDFIYVTGLLGGSQIKKHLNLTPRIEEARALVKKIKISSMMDISDGLSSDLMKLAKASKSGFEIHPDKILVSSDARRISKTEDEAIKHALNDGEDYELLFTVPEKHSKDVPSKILSTKITQIGKITSKKSYYGISKNGNRIKIKNTGFDHFKTPTN